MRSAGFFALLLAMLMIPGAYGTVNAAATCAGEAATIEKGNGPNVIVGTPRRDVIVSRGGDDEIFGRGGNDLICAGGGDDEVDGGGGRDRVFGAAGDDRVTGGPGDDSINGGRDSDRCVQGAGSGQIRNCERADFEATVFGPGAVEAGVPFVVDLTVANNGPDRAASTLIVESSNNDATCSGGLDSGAYLLTPLGDGGAHQSEMGITCTLEGTDDPFMRIEVRVIAHARDTNASNDSDTYQVPISEPE